jgi:hypothetical protein
VKWIFKLLLFALFSPRCQGFRSVLEHYVRAGIFGLGIKAGEVLANPGRCIRDKTSIQDRARLDSGSSGGVGMKEAA